MIQLSASMIKDFLTCSQRVYYRINYPEQAEKGMELLVGDIVHKLLEEFNKSPDMDVNNFLAKTHPNLPDKAVDKILTCVSNYWKYFQPLLSENDVVENFFKISYSSNIVIVGRIDRVNLERGILVDWKTGNKAPTSINNDIQFILYNWAYKKLYHSNPSMIALASLGSGKLVQYFHNEDYEKYLFDAIIPKVAHAIKEGSFYKEGIFDYVSGGSSSISCTYCPFKRVCLESSTEEE